MITLLLYLYICVMFIIKGGMRRLDYSGGHFAWVVVGGYRRRLVGNFCNPLYTTLKPSTRRNLSNARSTTGVSLRVFWYLYFLVFSVVSSLL